MSWAPPEGHYPGYLRIEDVWVPVHRISANPQVEFDRPVVIERTLSGRRRAQIGPTTHRDWSVRLGLSTPENLALWERLLTGGYGLGPFEWVDPWDNAAAGEPSGDEPNRDAPARLVVLASMSHAPRHISNLTKITAITITLSEVGAGE